MNQYQKKEIADADAFIYNSVGLEPYTKQISEAIESEGKR